MADIFPPTPDSANDAADTTPQLDLDPRDAEIAALKKQLEDTNAAKAQSITDNTPKIPAEEWTPEPAPEGWKRDDDGGITAVQVPWLGY